MIMTLSARDIIAKSIDTHPDLFRAACISQAESDDDCLKIFPHELRAVQARINACLAVYDAIARKDVDYILNDCGRKDVALNIAAKLQGLPGTAAAVDWNK
jgi:hypothetical protein